MLPDRVSNPGPLTLKGYLFRSRTGYVSERTKIGSVFHMLCPKYKGPLTIIALSATWLRKTSKLRSLILKLGFSLSCFQNQTNSNKTGHDDEAQLPPIFHQGLAYLSLLPDAAVACTKQQISKIGPQAKSN